MNFFYYLTDDQWLSLILIACTLFVMCFGLFCAWYSTRRRRNRYLRSVPAWAYVSRVRLRRRL